MFTNRDDDEDDDDENDNANDNGNAADYNSVIALTWWSYALCDYCDDTFTCMIS